MASSEIPKRFGAERTGSSPEGDLSKFDVRDFDDAGLDLPASLETPDRLLARLNNGGRKSDDVPQSNPGAALFPHVAFTGQFGVGKTTASSLWSIVVRAYADVRSDRSIDYVVAEPEANLLFLQRCWELGAPASPSQLNWLLMNARKNGKLADLSPAKRFSIAKEELDSFAFAADMAMRSVQDRLYFDEQRDASIDQILCDPHLVKEFDTFAAELAPGHSRFEYRWAAIALRKARRSANRSIQLSRFEARGSLEDVRASSMPTSGGIYWIQAGNSSLFTGVASNLRRQLGALVDQLGFNVAPRWVRDQPDAKPELRLWCEANFETAEIVRAGLLKRAGSRLNFRHGFFFGAAA
ncbi:MAG TPA: hypothetical protein VGR35_15535 [Tepidisphaeraceae bacterium]|nr:hypothetical protein [Tepidisphaeraceae bacterium]